MPVIRRLGAWAHAGGNGALHSVHAGRRSHDAPQCMRKCRQNHQYGQGTAPVAMDHLQGTAPVAIDILQTTAQVAMDLHVWAEACL